MSDNQLCAQLSKAAYEKVNFISWDYVIENLVGAI
jgi:hypothetical protein